MSNESNRTKRRSRSTRWRLTESETAGAKPTGEDELEELGWIICPWLAEDIAATADAESDGVDAKAAPGSELVLLLLLAPGTTAIFWSSRNALCLTAT